MAPTLEDALAALEDLNNIISPRRATGPSHKDSELDSWTQFRINGMASMLRQFTTPASATYRKWCLSACQLAISMGRGIYCARNLAVLNCAFIANRDVLPLNPFGDWNESLLVDENLTNEITIYLLSLGNDITARKLMQYLHQPDIKSRFGITRDISIRTARRYLHKLGYRYHLAPKGQYADGHERPDVVEYRQNGFLPRWRHLVRYMTTWPRNENERVQFPSLQPGEKGVVVWYHDESIFYAHDRQKKGWYHKDATASPYPKGEGLSLMVADFVSADFGWLRGVDGVRSARCVFRPGKNRDGWFMHHDIISQANAAINILETDYPQYRHVFIYDNAPTHLKRADDAPSASKMPKNVSKKDVVWGVMVEKVGPDGQPIIDPTTMKPVKELGLMRSTVFNGQPQSFYFPEDHPVEKNRGKFQGMVVILEERGVMNMESMRAQCRNFKCAPNATDCCLRRMLFTAPDFTNIPSLLEEACQSHQVEVLFLPKFHCELNFIEQCWGHAKGVYRTYPPSSREADLEKNMVKLLESVTLPMMRRFAARSSRFMDAYSKGLTGRQAAWASRKYRGHRVLPDSIMDELEKAGEAS